MVATAVSTPRADPSRRKTLSRFSTSRTSSNISLHRPPIILEWGSKLLRMGYAEQCRPTHSLPLDDKHHENKNDNKNEKINQKSASQWYAILAPIIYQVYYDHLMETDPSTRRVVCCCPGLFREDAWEAALLQIFWNLGAPAVTFVSGMQVVPLALGWKRGIVVAVGHDETHCLAHVDGHALQDTYQAVPCGSSVFTNVSNADQRPWWLDSRVPQSLTLALIKCLEACPRDALRDAASNLVVYGEDVVILPDVGRRLVVAVKEALVGDKTDEQEEPESNESDVLTVTPTDTHSLRPIADQLAVTSIAPYRPDLISWLGTSVWATMHFRHGFDSSNPVQNKWILKPDP